jgi:riboflavin kinase/FMN adenylyltransferase
MKTFWGKVKKGNQRGKDLGFPTANISVHQKMEEGIYLSKVRIHYSSSEQRESRSLKGNSSRQARTITYNALTFIGAAKTFGETKVFAESYLLDFSGDLYGKYITIQILKKLRDNKKFDSVEKLVQQMQEDLVNARKFFLEWC